MNCQTNNQLARNCEGIEFCLIIWTPINDFLGKMLRLEIGLSHFHEDDIGWVWAEQVSHFSSCLGGIVTSICSQKSKFYN